MARSTSLALLGTLLIAAGLALALREDAAEQGAPAPRSSADETVERGGSPSERSHSDARTVVAPGESSAPVDPAAPTSTLRLRVRVTDSHGHPVPNAKIVLGRWAVGGPGAELRRASVGTKGLLELRALPPPPWYVDVRAPGMGARRARTSTPVEELALQLAPEERLHLQLLDPAGHSLAGVRVRARSTDAHALEREGLTDLAGQLVLDQLATPMWQLEAQLDGFAPGQHAGARVGEGPHELVLYPYPPLAVSVSMDAGVQPQQSQVRAVPLGGAAPGTEPEPTPWRQLGLDGNALFEGLPTGSWRIEARGPNSRGASAPVSLGGAHATRDGVALRLRNAVSIEALVRRAGSPEAGARLRLWNLPYSANAARLLPPHAEGTSNERGVIHLGGLCAGELWGELVSARGERIAIEGFVLEPGDGEQLQLDLP